MDFQLLALYVGLSIINVGLQAFYGIALVKCSKQISACVSAVTFGFYTIVIVYTSCELPLFLKVGIVGICNFIGVYIVKSIEEKLKKDKLWKVDITTKIDNLEMLTYNLQKADLYYTFTETSPKMALITVYCNTQQESQKVKKIIDLYNCKYFCTESQTLY